jgi:DMSO reductase anchor subunit
MSYTLSIFGISVIMLGCLLLFVLSQSDNVNGQQASNFTKMFQDKYTKNMRVTSGFDYKYFTVTYVEVKYESPTTILISGKLIETNLGEFNSYLWQAMYLLKNQYGFKIEQIMTSGVGSVGNPTIVYILMTK